MGWQLEVGEKVIRFDDLPPSVFQKIVDGFEMSWLDLYLAPVKNTEAFTALIVAICQHADLPAPSMATIGELMHVWTAQVSEAPDDLPTSFGAGGVPLTDDPTTGSSSNSGSPPESVSANSENIPSATSI